MTPSQIDALIPEILALSTPVYHDQTMVDEIHLSATHPPDGTSFAVAQLQGPDWRQTPPDEINVLFLYAIHKESGQPSDILSILSSPLIAKIGQALNTQMLRKGWQVRLASIDVVNGSTNTRCIVPPIVGDFEWKRMNRKV